MSDSAIFNGIAYKNLYLGAVTFLLRLQVAAKFEAEHGRAASDEELEQMFTQFKESGNFEKAMERVAVLLGASVPQDDDDEEEEEEEEEEEDEVKDKENVENRVASKGRAATKASNKRKSTAGKGAAKSKVPKRAVA